MNGPLVSGVRTRVAPAGRRGGASRPPGIAIACLAVALLVPPALPAQEEAGQAPPPVVDSVVVLDALRAEVAPDTLPGLSLGVGRVPYVWAIDLENALGTLRLRDRLPGEDVLAWLGEREAEAAERRIARRDTMWAILMPMEDKLPEWFDQRGFFVRGDTLRDELDEMQPRDAPEQIDLLPDAIAGVADLELDISGTGRIGSQWQSFDPCTIGTGQRCESGALPTIKPDFQLRAVANGTISKRVHLDVDFDQTREFDATNDLTVYYEGLPGEILERAEVGEVTLPLPRSQFISQGIPAGNFGMRAEARVGPLTLRGVLAEQDGSVETRNLTLDVGGGEEGVLQDLETQIDDANYVSGQFFWVVDPRELAEYPDIDATALQITDAQQDVRPSSGLKLYLHEARAGQQNIEEGVIQARAVALRPEAADPALPDSVQFQGFFRPLVEGEDYISHDSGLWIVLKSRIQEGEALAATYITAAGDTVGDYNAEEIFRQIANSGSGELPVLELLRDPATHRPGGVTWEREMHQVYRVSSSPDVEQGSVALTISQGPIESGPIVRDLEGEDYTFLQIFGLDEQPTDDRLDAGRIWRPEASGGEGVVTGSYVVFPTLEPFKRPPPIAALDGERFPLTDGDLNQDMYDEPVDVLRLSSFRYRLNFSYRARTAGRASEFTLGALGIREGSETVTVDGRQLERGVDYAIDYEIGELQILRPAELFGTTGSPSLEVRFEQKPIFQVQPTSIVGLTGEYSFGERGQIDFIGLLQREGSVLTRPELGLEPGAVSLGGVVGSFEFEPTALDRFVNNLPGISTDLPSTISIDAEVAGSLPTTNRQGLTYVDDFEGGSRLRVGLGQRAWRRGSVVTRPDVDGNDYLPDSPGLDNRFAGVWQSQWLTSEGDLRGPLPTRDIDPAINVLNPQTTEGVLWVSLSDAPSGENGWLSLTQVLSETGLDLTAVEFLEFYALSLSSVSERIALIIDIGTVSEDALVPDSLGFAAGVGELDQEADPLVGVWGNQDDTGIWDQACVAEPDVTAYPLNDPRANCTNNNGLEDTEDLNRDNFLNQDERFLRYVVPLNVSSRYFDREAQSGFRKFRIPLALPDLMQNATEGTRQNVKHIRITFASDRAETILLSRMEFSGSPWLKRAGSGSVDGFLGQAPGTANQVAVGPISTTDAGYVSPPGIRDREAQSTDDLTAETQPINEQSLRLTFEDVPPGERIEIFRRFSERPRNFLLYRQLRAWALPLQGEFGPDAPLRFYMRLGFDSENFYLYRTPLQPPVGEMPQREDWQPERFVDFERWIELRAEAERQLIDVGADLPPDSAIVVWDVDVFPDGDSTHAVVISDRSRAPNLSAIRETAMGVENVGMATAGPGEIWVDDLRLGDAADRGGTALRAGVAVALADVARFETRLSRQNPFYRQLGDAPSFRSERDFSTRGRVEFGRFLPTDLGLQMPITFQHNSSGTDPFFTQDGDLLAERIPGLRTPSSSTTSWGVNLSKARPSSSPLLRATVDGLRLGFSRRNTNQTTRQSEAEVRGWSATAAWSRPVADASIPVLPGFLKAVLDALPGFISNSTIVENLRTLRFRYTPSDLSLSATLNSNRTERSRFTSSVSIADEAVTPTINRVHTLSPRAGVRLQPFPSLVAGLTLATQRDLVDPRFRVSGPEGREVLEAERRDFLGLPVGWETSRSVRGNLAYQPEIASWFDSRLTVNTSYETARNPSYVTSLSGASDTTLVRDARLVRDMALDLDVEPSSVLSLFGVAPAGSAEGFEAKLRSVWDRLRPVRFAWSRSVSATYDRREIEPSFGDQLVLDGFERLRFFTGSDTASSATRRSRFQVRGGVELPLNLDAELDYSVTENESFQLRSRRSTEDTAWPVVRLRWRSIPIPGFLDGEIRTISLTGEWQDSERVTGTTTGQDRGSESLDRSLTVSVVLESGFNLSYGVTNSTSERTDGSGFSRSNRNSHTLRGTGTVPAPGFLGFIRNPLRLSAEAILNGNADCRELGGGGFTGSFVPGTQDAEGCVDYVDQTQNTLRLALDSQFDGYDLGVQLQWVRRASGVGTRQSSNQYNFDVYGRFYLQTTTTEIPPAGGR